MQESVPDLDADPLGPDPRNLDEVTRWLLAHCGSDADHVEMRRTAARLFPGLARSDERWLDALVGHAATLRVDDQPRSRRDVTDARLQMTPTAPIAYPASYAELDDATRATLVSFCEDELGAGRDGPHALANLQSQHGWPYTERTFYVGPWKAARMRRRRRQV